MKQLSLEAKARHMGNLLLINAEHPLCWDANPLQLVPVDEAHPHLYLHREAQSMLKNLLQSLSTEDEIVPVSGYRSRAEQSRIYADSLRENGPVFTQSYVARPDHSEHQSGLAIDLGEKQGEIDFLCPAFPYHGICQKLREKAPAFGFIERYGQGKEAITGVGHEPWHFRYLGYPHSLLLSNMGLTLEEYCEYLKRFPEDGEHLFFSAGGHRAEIYYIPFRGESKVISIPDHIPYQLSGNNYDGVVLTLWHIQKPAWRT